MEFLFSLVFHTVLCQNVIQTIKDIREVFDT